MQYSIAAFTLLSLVSSSLALYIPGRRGVDFSTVENTTDPHDRTPGSGGSWTVILDNDDPRTLDEMLEIMDLCVDDLTHVYNNSAFKGFAGSMTQHHVTSMANQTGLKTFEPEMEIRVADTQTDATWGLQRISQGRAMQNTASVGAYNFKYQFSGSQSTLGQNVDVYMVDTGINTDHIDFHGRATYGFAFDGNHTDDEGHG